MKIIYTLSRGQAAVIQGFSINKNLLAQNVKPETSPARLTIIEPMFRNKVTPHVT